MVGLESHMINIYIYSNQPKIEKMEKKTIIQFFEKYKVKAKIVFTTDYNVILDNLLEIDIIFFYDDVWSDMYKIIELLTEKKEENGKEVYIVKTRFPINAQKLESNKQKLLPKDTIIILKTKKGVIRIRSKRILYFENIDRKVFAHTMEGAFEIINHMQELQQDLKDESFLLAYVSILVNPYWIKQITGYEIILKNKETLPLSQKKAAAFRKEYKKYISLEL